jgi:hypothetical protein
LTRDDKGRRETMMIASVIEDEPHLKHVRIDLRTNAPTWRANYWKYKLRQWRSMTVHMNQVGSTHDTNLYCFSQGVSYVQWRFDLLFCMLTVYKDAKTV